MKPRTQQVLGRYPPSLWRFSPTRQLDQLEKQEGLLTRFLRVAEGPLFAVTVNTTENLPSGLFASLTPMQRVEQLHDLVRERLGGAPVLYGDWEINSQGHPHFHALTDRRGAVLFRRRFKDAHVQPVDAGRGGHRRWVMYLLKPRYAAQVKQAIRLIEQGDEARGTQVLDAALAEVQRNRLRLRTQDGRRRMPNRLHSQGVPDAFIPLRDEEWERVKAVLPHVRTGSGRPPCDQRALLNAVLWQRHYGLPWRHLPHGFPSRSSCARWEKQGRESGLLGRLAPALPPRMRGSFETGSD